MAQLIAPPVVIPAAGNPPKVIEEFVGLVAGPIPKAPANRDRECDNGPAPKAPAIRDRECGSVPAPKAPANRDRGCDSVSAPGLSIARMKSPRGWAEPGQTPEFDEYSIVLRGLLRVETRAEAFDVPAGRAVLAPRGEWVRYSTPEEGGAEYLSVCLPAFSPETAHRDR